MTGAHEVKSSEGIAYAWRVCILYVPGAYIGRVTWMGGEQGGMVGRRVKLFFGFRLVR